MFYIDQIKPWKAKQAEHSKDSEGGRGGSTYMDGETRDERGGRTVVGSREYIGRQESETDGRMWGIVLCCGPEWRRDEDAKRERT